MGKINFKNILLLLIVLLLSNTVFAQSIEGVVITEQNSAVGNVSVILKNSEDKTITYQFTKPDGSFSFANLDSKKYTLQCNRSEERRVGKECRSRRSPEQ